MLASDTGQCHNRWVRVFTVRLSYCKYMGIRRGGCCFARGFDRVQLFFPAADRHACNRGSSELGSSLQHVCDLTDREPLVGSGQTTCGGCNGTTTRPGTLVHIQPSDSVD